MKDDLNRMKMEYEGIAIPNDLKKKVEQGITQAKLDREQEKNFPQKRGAGYWSKRIVVGVVAVSLALVIIVNCNNTIAYAMKDIPVIGSIVEVVIFKTYVSEDKDMKANVETPYVKVEEDSIVKDAAEEMNQKIQEYTDRVIEQYKDDVKECNGEGYEEVTTDYEVVTDNAQLFSLRINTTVALNTSGITIKIYHIDKTTGKMITLSDLFVEGSDYKTIISENIKEQMREEMKEKDGEVIYFLDDTEFEEWNFKSITDEANFYFNEENNLVFVFDKYEVAPGYMGVCEFEIPAEITKTLLKECYQ